MIIGRKEEQVILKQALASSEAEMISVIGRRRVGKTFLVREVYVKEILFEISGLQRGKKSEQLRNFANQLKKYSGSDILIPTPKDWLEAFFILTDWLDKIDLTQKKVVFFDEVPWMDTHKSDFLTGLSYFWNSWAVKKNIVVVICGSAASWMIQKILRSRGGLHNRVTKRIRLNPFSLLESAEFLEARGIRLEYYQMLQIYMVMGGIPHYLKEIEKGKSATQNISKICFSDSGLLRDEFLSLYPALFEYSEYHTKLVRILASKPTGLTRTQLIEYSKINDSGRVAKVLEELAESGFVTAYPAFGKKKKGKIYRLTDEYSIFYLRFIEDNLLEAEGVWLNLSQSQAYKIWCGYAFENVCLKHIKSTQKALGIGGVYSRVSTFYKPGTETYPDVQIDLLVDRNDQTINLVEIKFYNGIFSISKEYATNLKEKIQTFREVTKTKKQIFLTLISALGLKSNTHSLGLVDQDFSAEIFFKE